MNLDSCEIRRLSLVLPSYCVVESRVFVHYNVVSFLLTASVMFKFADQQTVRRVVRALPPVGVGTYYGIPQTRYACFGMFVCWLEFYLFACFCISWFLMWTSFSGRHHCTLPASCSKNPPWRIVGRKEKCRIFSTSCSWTPSPVSRLSSSNPHVLFPWLTSKSGWRKRMPLFFAWSGCLKLVHWCLVWNLFSCVRTDDSETLYVTQKSDLTSKFFGSKIIDVQF